MATRKATQIEDAAGNLYDVKDAEAREELAGVKSALKLLNTEPVYPENTSFFDSANILDFASASYDLAFAISKVSVTRSTRSVRVTNNSGNAVSIFLAIPFPSNGKYFANFVYTTTQSTTNVRFFEGTETLIAGIYSGTTCTLNNIDSTKTYNVRLYLADGEDLDITSATITKDGAKDYLKNQYLNIDTTGKADKVSSATNGNFAGLDSNGNLTDSGHKHSDYLTSHQDITGKADKVASPTNGNFAALDSNGNLTDSGHKHSDYLTSHQSLSGKADKVSNPTNGHFASLDSSGNIADSGHSHSDYTALIGAKVNKPNGNGTSGQVLRTNGDGTTDWASIGLPTDAQTADAVSDWLNDHPEATTTVQDHSLTYSKMVNGTMNFITPEMFGAIGDGETDDTDAIKSAIESDYAVCLCEGKTYVISSPISTSHDCVIYGNGATIKDTYNSNNHPALKFENCTVRLYDLVIVGNRANATYEDTAIHLVDSNAFISGCVIREFSAKAFIINNGTTIVDNIVMENIYGTEANAFVYASGVSTKTNFSNVIARNDYYRTEHKGQIFYLNGGFHNITNVKGYELGKPFDLRTGVLVAQNGYFYHTDGPFAYQDNPNAASPIIMLTGMVFDKVTKFDNNASTIINISKVKSLIMRDCVLNIDSELGSGGISWLIRFYGTAGSIKLNNIQVYGDNIISNGMNVSNAADAAEIEITNCNFPVLNTSNAYIVQQYGTTSYKMRITNTSFKNKTNRLYGWDATNNVLANSVVYIPTFNALGATADRPNVAPNVSALYYDTTLGKLIVWNGTAWVNTDGTALT